MRHLLRVVVIPIAVIGGTYYPFLPGDFDRAAQTISTVAQVLAVAMLLFVPVGVIWLLAQARPGAADTPAQAPRGVVVTTTVVTLLVAALTTLAAWASGSAASAVALVVAAALSGRGCRAWLNRLAADRAVARVWAWQMIVVPLVVLILSVSFAPMAPAFSRTRAMDNAGAVIAGLENYRAKQGEYPESFVALSPDFATGVVGIDHFQYARHGDAYTLSFRQPSLVFWRFGTEEVVVYNPRDEHLFPSHAAWFLESPTGVIRMRQGFYDEGEAGRPHWRYFWFD